MFALRTCALGLVRKSVLRREKRFQRLAAKPPIVERVGVQRIGVMCLNEHEAAWAKNFPYLRCGKPRLANMLKHGAGDHGINAGLRKGLREVFGVDNNIDIQASLKITSDVPNRVPYPASS